ncbi:ABC transporter substrate-binding protein [Fluviispira vulneris]|uniref:ABC transporter substrate-binding protein n=1 Tax=Fluviispira vulneris TaxID=2763012 RepID=UPI0016448B09|nr:ABC transporter substrate-binding protein [Fluviispira vulneris]
MYSDSDIYNDKKTLTINLGETPYIPWNYVDTATNVVETFGSAVFGNLIDLVELSTKKDPYILVDNYSCKNKKCIINLKENVKFHNGRTVTAFDVEFSFIRLLMQNREDNFAFSNLDDIEGIDSLMPVKYQMINHLNYPRSVLSGFEVINDHQIILHLKRDNNFLLQKLSSAYMPIVPIEELTENYADWKGIPIGFGRYKIVKSDLEKYQFVLEKTSNEDIPKYIRIIFENKDIGDLRFLSHMSESQYDGKVLFPNIYVNGGFLFNFKSKLGSNENFRAAISLALDREKIVNFSPDNDLVAEDQMLARYSWQERYRSRENLTVQNVELAKEYLNKVPAELWRGKEFNVHSFWSIKKDLNSVNYIKEIKRQLSEIGINLKFYNTDLNYTKFKKDDENVLWFTGFDTQTDDPNANFAYFKAGSFFNNIYPENDKEFLDLYELSVNNFLSNPEYTRNLSKYFKKKNYMVVIFNVKKRFAYRKDRIEFLESEYSGVRLDLWKIKLLDFKLF